MDEFVNLIGNLGFPIAVCSYLLIRFEKKIDSLNESIQELNTSIKENPRN